VSDPATLAPLPGDTDSTASVRRLVPADGPCRQQAAGPIPVDADGSGPQVEQPHLISEITAHRSGRLYLYLNDAVLFAPGGWKQFYANNGRYAWVTVTEYPVNKSR